MKKGSIIVLMVLAFFGCENQETNTCSTPATVRNLTGLDGCGWAFELADGTKLEPNSFVGRPHCGTEDEMKKPLDDFEFVDGKRVFISYDIFKDAASTCMVGPIVNITCIREATSTASEQIISEVQTYNPE